MRYSDKDKAHRSDQISNQKNETTKMRSIATMEASVDDTQNKSYRSKLKADRRQRSSPCIRCWISLQISFLDIYEVIAGQWNEMDNEGLGMFCVMTLIVSSGSLCLVLFGDWLPLAERNVVDLVNDTLRDNMGYPDHKLTHWILHVVYVCGLVESSTFILMAFRQCLHSVSMPVSVQWIITVFWTMVFFGLLFAEMLLLRDMRVHILDMDLSASHGLWSTVKRQFVLGQKGRFIPNHGNLAQHSAILLAVTTTAFIVGARYLSRRHPLRIRKCLVRYHELMSLSAIFGTAFLVCFSPLSSTETQFHYNMLPFNFVLWPLLGDTALIHIGADNLNYPAFKCPPKNQSADMFNIVLLTQETWPLPFWKDTAVSHHLRMFIDELSTEKRSHQCIEFEHHWSLSRVTEMAHFALYYGAYQMYADSFQTEHIASNSMRILRECHHFDTAYFSEDAPWLFPNSFLIDGHFDESERAPYGRDAAAGDFQLIPLIESWLRRRQHANASNPFLLHHHIYSHQSDRVSDALNISRPSPTRRDLDGVSIIRQINADENKLNFLKMLQRELKQEVEATAFIFTNDHGVRGSKDGNWSTDRVQSPLVMCIPMEVANGLSTENVEELTTSHIDIMPTLLELQGIDSQSNAYYHGASIWKRAAWNHQIRDREFLYFVPRFFPQKAKVLGLHHISSRRTLHFLVENDRFKIRFLYLADHQNVVICNHHQLREGTLPRCDTEIWDRGIELFQSDKIFGKFLK